MSEDDKAKWFGYLAWTLGPCIALVCIGYLVYFALEVAQ